MKALLVDDERIARAEMRRLLAAHPEVEIVGEAQSGAEALLQIPRLQPDVLLDVQMPGMTGFDLLDQLEDVPEVIFTTAYDQYALKAFEVNALDYLVKPVAPDRLATALARLQKTTTRLAAPAPDRVFLRDGERCWIVPVADILLLESEGNYTRVFFRQEHPLIPRSLAALEARLPPDDFFRAGRRYIVNLNAIDRVEPGVAGNLLATLRTGQTVEFSRRQSVRLRERWSL